MKTNKMCALVGNLHRYQELMPLIKNRPLATLPFDAKFQVQVSQSRKPTCYLILNVLQYWLDNDQEDGIRDKRNGAGF